MDSNVHVDLWKLSQSDFEAGWELGQVLIESETRYKLVAKVVRGSAGNGWAGLDDFEFYHDQVDCPTLPENAKPPPPPTTEPPPGLYFQFTNFWEGFLILESRWVFLFIQYRFLFTDMQILLFNFPFTHCFCASRRHNEMRKNFSKKFLRRTDFFFQNLISALERC